MRPQNCDGWPVGRHDRDRERERSRQRRRATRPDTVGRVPEGLAERMGKGLTRAMNQAIIEHPDFPEAFLPLAIPNVATNSLNNWIGAEAKR